MIRILAPRLLLDLGRVEQGRDDRRRAYADCNARLHQLCPALLIGRVAIVVPVAHRSLSMAFAAA